jgi:hypothetical protein
MMKKNKLNFKCYFCSVDMIKYDKSHYFLVYDDKEILCCQHCKDKYINKKNIQKTNTQPL